MKRLSVILSVLVALSMLLAACGSAAPAATEAPAATDAAPAVTEAPAAATDAPVASAELEDTLKVWSFTNDTLVLATAFQEIHPKVKIEFTMILMNGGEFQTKVRAAAGTADAPDIVALEAAFVREWVEADGLLADQSKDKDYDGIALKTVQCVNWVQSARDMSIFSGIEHIGLYAHKSDPATLSAWYEQTFDLKSKEGNSSFFVSGAGSGRIEVPKVSADAQVHIAVRVTNFEAAAANLQAKGISLKDVIIKSESKSGYLDVADPEGNLVHLLWLPKR